LEPVVLKEVEMARPIEKPSYRNAARSLIVLTLAGSVAAFPAQALAEDSEDSVGSGQESTDQTTAEQSATAQTASAQSAVPTTETMNATTSTQGEAAGVSTTDPATGESLYQVQVNYVDADGNKVAPSYVKAFSEGASWSATSPSIEGMELVDASQATLSGTVGGSTHNLVYNVTYQVSTVSYTVVYELQTSDGYTRLTETRTAPAGSSVTVEAPTFDGYTCVTSATGRSTVVAADGSTTVTLRYERNRQTYGVYFVTNGDEAIDPQIGLVGKAVTAPDDPTRTGYDFVGWDIDGDGAADTLPTTIADHDVIATAVWTPSSDTRYQVRYIIEGAGTTAGKDTEYKTVERTGTTGETATYDLLNSTDDASILRYYQFDYATEVPIAADGSTVVDVYYESKDVTVYINAEVNGEVRLLATPYTVKIGEPITWDADAVEQTAHELGISGSIYRWESEIGGQGVPWGYPMSTILIGTDAQGNNYASIVPQFTTNEISSFYSRSIFETPDGEGDRAGRFAEYLRVGSSSSMYFTMNTLPTGYQLARYRISTEPWDGEEESTITWGEWVNVTDAQRQMRYISLLVTSACNTLEAYFELLDYTVTFWSNGSIYQQGDYPYTSVVSFPEEPTREGYYFAGWYDNAEFTGSPVTSITVNSSDNDYYACWKRLPVTVTFDSAGGTPVDDETVDYGARATAPEDPTRTDYVFAGWYLMDDGSGESVRFTFDAPLEADITLFASWEAEDQLTTYTVIHRTSDGTILAQETYQGIVGESVSAAPLSLEQRGGWNYVDSLGEALVLGESDNQIVFTYYRDARHAYVIRFVDRSTGEEIERSVMLYVIDALVTYDAPRIDGYVLAGNARGYLTAASDGSPTVLTFYYDRERGDDGTGAAVKAGHTEELPSTSDEATGFSPVAMLGGLAVLGGLLARRRHEEE
jgi:uncharacterized repeat protein (TIGR02543 family)/LPXTG-motif cell wall-anchored protein